MTSIEKATLPISKVAIIMIAVGGFITTVLGLYYGTKSAIQDGFNEVKLEIQDLRNEDKLIKKDVFDVTQRTDKLESAAMNYLSKKSSK